MNGFQQAQKRPRNGAVLLSPVRRAAQPPLLNYPRPIHRQFTQHDQLRNPQKHMPMRAIHQPGEVGGHGFGRGKGFAGVGQQFFAVDAGGDEVAGVGFEQRFSGEQRIEVVIEGAFGGFVEGL